MAAAARPGLEQAAEAFRRKAGDRVTISFATGPEIQQRIGAGEAGFDIVVAPDAVLAALHETGRLTGVAVPLGRVGIAVAVRKGAPHPDIHDAAAFTRALLAADGIVIARGSTGVYLERWFAEAGLAERLNPRIVRRRSGEDVGARLAAGSGTELGMSAQTELARATADGIEIVGPLPAGVQTEIGYAAATLVPSSRGARFLALLATPKVRAMIKASGIR